MNPPTPEELAAMKRAPEIMAWFAKAAEERDDAVATLEACRDDLMNASQNAADRFRQVASLTADLVRVRTQRDELSAALAKGTLPLRERAARQQEQIAALVKLTDALSEDERIRKEIESRGAVFWNPDNGVVQDHRDGTIIQPDTDKERAKRGLPPFTPDPGPQTLRDRIRDAINRTSAENESDTPDFVLADYLLASLDAFDAATRTREKWYGREPKASEVQLDEPTGK